MKKSNQKLTVDAMTPAIPEQVSVAMAEIAENMQEGLLASDVKTQTVQRGDVI